MPLKFTQLTLLANIFSLSQKFQNINVASSRASKSFFAYIHLNFAATTKNVYRETFYTVMVKVEA